MALRSTLSLFRLFLVTCFAIPLGHAQGQDKQAYVVVGVGTATCESFTSIYRGSPDYAEDVFIAWAQGFMSGVNMRLPSGKRADITYSDTYFLELKEFCDAHPQGSFLGALADLMDELRDEQGLGDWRLK